MSLSYSLLLLPTGPDFGHDELEPLGLELVTWRGQLGKAIEPMSLKGWEDALGRFDWTELTGLHRIVMTSCNPWNGNVPERLDPAHLAMKLVPLINPLQGIVHRLTGGALSTDPVKLDGISTHRRYPKIPRPLYTSQDDYFRAYRGDDGVTLDPPWFDEWKQWVSHLEAIRQDVKPLILRNAVGSFERGLTHEDIDARIPEFVRAAEAIIALPRHQGGTPVFVRRAMHFVAPLANDPYLSAGAVPTLPPSHIAKGSQGERYRAWFNSVTDLEKRLAVLYGHRSDCVHGKVPFEELRKAGGDDAHAARFDWLAEQLARRVVGHALRNKPRWVEFADRETLEDAWRPINKSAPRLP